MKLRIKLLFFANFFTYLHTETICITVINKSGNPIKCLCMPTYDQEINKLYYWFDLDRYIPWQTIYDFSKFEFLYHDPFSSYHYVFIRDGDIRIIKKFGPSCEFEVRSVNHLGEEFGKYKEFFEYTFVYDRNDDETKKMRELQELIEWNEFGVDFHY